MNDHEHEFTQAFSRCDRCEEAEREVKYYTNFDVSHMWIGDEHRSTWGTLRANDSATRVAELESQVDVIITEVD